MPIYDSAVSRPVRDPRYLAWIRTLPCSVGGCRRRSEANHTGAKGLSQRASDWRAIPTCSVHHREYHRIGRHKFEQRYGVDIEALIARLNQKPAIKIQGARYVAVLADEEHDLGSVRQSLAAVIRLAVRMARSRIPL
jgi:hypothetical protein